MAERGRQGDARRVGDPGRRRARGKGFSSRGLLVAAAAVAVIVGIGLILGWAAGSRRPHGPAPATAPSGTPVPAGRSAPVTSAGVVATATAPASQDPSPTPGEGPDSAVKAAALRYPGAPAVTPETIGHANPSRKLVAITIDDGIPFDVRILELFEQRKLAATTFLLGEFAARNPVLMARLERDGFEIANHTWDHKTLTRLSDAQVRSEASRTQQAISRVTGDQAPYLRPPGGATNGRIRTIAASMGYRIVLWNKSFADTSRAATPERLFHNVMDGLKPGDIILCHWGGRSTYEALQLILPEMERRGFTPVTLSEMLRDSGAPVGVAAP